MRGRRPPRRCAIDQNAIECLFSAALLGFARGQVYNRLRLQLPRRPHGVDFEVGYCGHFTDRR